MKTDDCWTHSAAVSRQFIKLAHSICIGPAVKLWLAIALANLLIASASIILGDLQKKILTTATPTQIIMLQNVLADRFDTLTEHFGIFRAFQSCSLVHTSSSAITFDSHFHQTWSWDLSGTFLDKGHRTFLAEIIEIVKLTGSVGHPQWCHD